MSGSASDICGIASLKSERWIDSISVQILSAFTWNIRISWWRGIKIDFLRNGVGKTDRTRELYEVVLKTAEIRLPDSCSEFFFVASIDCFENHLIEHVTSSEQEKTTDYPKRARCPLYHNRKRTIRLSGGFLARLILFRVLSRQELWWDAFVLQLRSILPPVAIRVRAPTWIKHHCSVLLWTNSG